MSCSVSSHRWHGLLRRHRSRTLRAKSGQHLASPLSFPLSRFEFRYPELFLIQRLTAAYCSFYAVPFTLMNIHFLYRFWSIRFPHLIELFSSKKFISQIAAILSGGFIVWWVVISKRIFYNQPLDVHSRGNGRLSQVSRLRERLIGRRERTGDGAGSKRVRASIWQNTQGRLGTRRLFGDFFVLFLYYLREVHTPLAMCNQCVSIIHT